MIDEIEPAPAAISGLMTVFMVWTMFFMAPEYWSVVPVWARLTVAVMTAPIAYFVVVRMTQ